ncbi:MAG TPA: hypothetical protein VD765_03360 [Solirubrobacterales bacterium]|nr:hypothetical protein [Solirubrobacterales bacterium]
MEASERPQLSLDQPAGDGTVRVVENRLVIERLTVADAGAARVVREQATEGRPPAETVTKAIEIGTRLIESEGTAANVDYVKRELGEGLDELDRRLGGTLEEGAEALSERIAATFGAERNDSVQAQIKEIVTREARQQREQLFSSLTAEDTSNPLNAMQVRIGQKILETEERHRTEVEKLRESHATQSRAMQTQVHELKEHLARLLDKDEHELELAEAEAAGTRKGISFEERVHTAIEAIAGARGDVATHTGGERAEGGGKKGDTLIEIGACAGSSQGRIVFEAKDKRLSKNAAWAELNGAMEARAASFAVLVVAGEENLPSGREELTEYEGNKLIVAVDRDQPEGLGLAIAYRLAAARVAMARDRDLEVDAIAVRDTAAEAISLLKQAQAIRSAMTGIKTSSDKARAGLDSMVAALEERLERIDALVAEEAAEAEAGL